MSKYSLILASAKMLLSSKVSSIKSRMHSNYQVCLLLLRKLIGISTNSRTSAINIIKTSSFKLQKQQNNLKNQQQLAGILFLTVWHLTHTSSVSLQLSTQKGQHHATPVNANRHRHQRIVTHPTFFRGMLPVSLPQAGQGEPSLFPPPLFPRLMIMGPCWGAGWGGGGQQTGGGGGAYIGATGATGAYIGAMGAMGAPYIDYKTDYTSDQMNEDIYPEQKLLVWFFFIDVVQFYFCFFCLRVYLDLINIRLKFEVAQLCCQN